MLERLNLRQPSLEHLRFSAMMNTVRDVIGNDRERVVLIGSSLGGLAAARVAEQDPRVCALVLLAPAFRMFERWREKMTDDQWRAWRETGWLEIDDYAEKTRSRIDFDFIREASAIDQRSNGWPDVRVPTLILHGTGDESVEIELSRTFAKDKKHVTLIELDDDHSLGNSIGAICRACDEFLHGFLSHRG